MPSRHSTFMVVWGETIFIGLDLLRLGLVCLCSAFFIAGSLKAPRQRALCVYPVLNLVCGLSDYLGYGDVIQGNILLILNATFTPWYDHSSTMRPLVVPPHESLRRVTLVSICVYFGAQLVTILT
jgi:hypothetical protein